MLKIAVFLTILAVVSAQQGPALPRDYSFGYNINAPETGDVKYHAESRQGAVTSGSYGLEEFDRRTDVTYKTEDAIVVPPQLQVIVPAPQQQVFTAAPSYAYPGQYQFGYPLQYPLTANYPYYPINGVGARYQVL